MNKSGATIAVIASIPLLVLGVIFLIAAATNPSRILVAGVFLLLGGVLLAWGALRLRRLAEISPEALNTGIVDLARRLGGEVTVAQVQAEFNVPQDLALSVLERMRGQGQCQRDAQTAVVPWRLSRNRQVYVPTFFGRGFLEDFLPGSCPSRCFPLPGSCAVLNTGLLLITIPSGTALRIQNTIQGYAYPGRHRSAAGQHVDSASRSL